MLEDFTLINVTAVALSQLIFERRQDGSCYSMFSDFYAKIICRDESIRPTNYAGVLVWVQAYYQGFQPSKRKIFDAQAFLRKKLNLGSSVTALEEVINRSRLKIYLDEIEADFQRIFNCASKPCDKKYLAQIQFLSSSVTNPKVSKYDHLDYPSIIKIEGNKVLLGNKIPEISGFYRIHFNHSGKIFGGDPTSLLGSSKSNLI